VYKPHEANSVWRAVHGFVSFLRPLLCKVVVEGRQHLPATGGCIVVCNHTMGPDYIVLGYVSPRQLYYMAKAEAFNFHPLITKLLLAAGVFPVRRGARDLAAIEAGVEIIRQGHVLGMYPEGTRSPTGVLQRGKSGATRIAMLSGAPVVPVVVIDSVAIYHNMGRFWRRPTVTVRFGPPFYLAGDTSETATVRENMDRMMTAMATLLPVELRGEFEEKN
jgi:1-acyl-sn-glycerol-3-phosphate acyltransferase